MKLQFHHSARSSHKWCEANEPASEDLQHLSAAKRVGVLALADLEILEKVPKKMPPGGGIRRGKSPYLANLLRFVELSQNSRERIGMHSQQLRGSAFMAGSRPQGLLNR